MVAAPVEAKTEVAAAKEVEKAQLSAEDLKKAADSKDTEEAKPMEIEASKDLSPEDVSAKLAKAAEKLSAGKKALLQNQFQPAVDNLAEACALQSSVKGDMCQSMCEFYFYYGRALLDLARVEEDVIGHALTGVPDGDDLENSQVENPEKMTEEEKETVAQQVDEALEENFSKVEALKTGKGEEADKEEAMEEGEASQVEEDKKEDSKVEDKKEKDSKAEDEPKKEENEDKVEEKSDKDAKPEESKDKKDDKEAKEEKKEDAEESKEKSSSDAPVVNGSSKEEKEGEEAADGEAGGEDAEEDEDEEEGEEAAEDEAAAEGEEVSQEDSQEDEDVSSLQLAWEVLELAKTIYLKKEDKSEDELLKLSQVYLKLGEVSLENEDYPESINMYSECLKLQETLLPADDRWLAETHYQLGLAHSFADNFDESVQQLQAATSVIESRIASHTKKLAEDKIEITDDMDLAALTPEQKSAVTDIRELKKLLPELQEKVVDIKDTKDSITEKLKAMKAHFAGQLSGGSSGKSVFEDGASTSTASAFEQSEGAESSKDAKPISTSLIRKKRKPDEPQAAEVAKKPRIEEPAAEKASEEKPKKDESADKKETATESEEKKDDAAAKEKKEESEEKMDVQESEEKKSES